MTDAEAQEGSTREADVLALLRALFACFSLVSALSLLLRFDGLGKLMPLPPWLPVLQQALLFAHGPMLLAIAACEVRMKRGSVGPEWMRLQEPWLKRALTLAFTFLSVVTIQELGIEIGEIDPSAPEGWPEPQRLLWFVGFGFGMGFANYLAVVDSLLPVLRLLVRPFRGLSMPGATFAAAIFGAAISAAIGYVLTLPVVRTGLERLSEWLDSPAALIGLIVGPLLLARAFRRSES